MMKSIVGKLPILLSILLWVACKNSPGYYDGVYIVGTEGKDVTAALTVDDVPSAIGINVASSSLATENLTIDMKVNPELVETFNKEHHKNYELLPASAYKLDNTQLKIEQGKHITTTGMRLSIVNRDDMKMGITYVLPVSIEKVEGGKLPVIEASRTIYVVVNQVIVTKAADLDQPWRYYYADFSHESKFNTKAMKTVTFEARVRFRKMNASSSKWCYSVMGLEENLCLRTAGGPKDGWKLQLGDPNHMDSRDVLPNDKWVHLACVYNGETGKKYLYINGELQAETTDSRPTISLASAYGQHDLFFIGQSANDDRCMEGWVSEARVWATARTAAELKNNVCWVDPLSEGLVAYWRFNEAHQSGSYYSVTDLTGNGYDAYYYGWYDGGVPSFVDAVRCPE